LGGDSGLHDHPPFVRPAVGGVAHFVQVADLGLALPVLVTGLGEERLGQCLRP
jgi:hypothetical protein